MRAIFDDFFLPFQQSEAYGSAARGCGAAVFDADLGVGQALVVARGRMRLISRGPVWQPGVTDRAKRQALRRFARWPGVTVATPEDGLAGVGLLPLVTPLHHAVWDLAGDLRGGLAGKWRNRLVTAERSGVRPEPAGIGTLADLVAREAVLRRGRGYRGLPPGFSAALPPGSLRLWQWCCDGQVAAMMCFVRHGATASYHMGWGDAVARGRSAHQAMLWQAALDLRDEGVRWLDLGSVDTEAAPGLARFKLGTGAALRRLGATLLVLPG